jgi:hypothetical protein
MGRYHVCDVQRYGAGMEIDYIRWGGLCYLPNMQRFRQGLGKEVSREIHWQRSSLLNHRIRQSRMGSSTKAVNKEREVPKVWQAHLQGCRRSLYAKIESDFPLC